MRQYIHPCSRLLVLVLALCTAVGCSSSKTDDDNGEVKPPQEDLGGPLPGEPEVAYQPWAETAASIESSPGSVTAVMFWSEGTKFVEEEINEFVRMAKIFRDEDVEFVSVNLNSALNDTDDRKTRVKAVQKFLTEHEANFRHLLSVAPQFELLMSTGSVRFPAIFLYDKTGKLRHKISVSLDSDKDSPLPIRSDVIPQVKLLLEEETPAEDANKTPEKTNESEEKPSQPESKPVAKSDVELQTLNWEQTQEIVAKHRGKVVVLDLWSNHCLPCMQEFPNLVKLQASYPEQVKCISFNMDYQGNGKPESNREFVMEFLNSQNATLTNVMSNVADEKLYDKLKLGSLPAIYVYGQDGNVAKRFDANSAGEFTYEADVIPLVKELLAAK
ncbi:TlpA disulfide reductase family protein [Thalassoroseus pseudoceratinae]|uniref:TlpA disulfide reductase family protein n=1 Tax=Thalassoroseus pseudoceratinae TaxID=2713176 RepID=UPI0014213838|nr:TlpA disulfide reductase family protein [Thalassoroseus pseudoceratinae]